MYSSIVGIGCSTGFISGTNGLNSSFSSCKVSLITGVSLTTLFNALLTSFTKLFWYKSLIWSKQAFISVYNAALNLDTHSSLSFSDAELPASSSVNEFISLSISSLVFVSLKKSWKTISAKIYGLNSSYSKCELWTTSNGHTRKYKINADSQAILQTYWIIICTLKRFPMIHMYFMVWK